jgi:hypothetical protein
MRGVGFLFGVLSIAEFGMAHKRLLISIYPLRPWHKYVLVSQLMRRPTSRTETKDAKEVKHKS